MMPYAESDYFGGLDLGQAVDYTALAIVERITYSHSREDVYTYAGNYPRLPPTAYNIRHLERLPRGVSYPDQVAHVKALVEKPPLQGAVTLAVDITGCGRPVFDMFRDAHLTCHLDAVLIHGGDHVTREDIWRVPKRDLVATVQVLLQGAQVKIAESLPDAALLKREMENFRVKIDPQTAHDSYSAWRESQHDDLVLAVAMALWVAKEARPIGIIPLTFF
jgi:hypothetical protein